MDMTAAMELRVKNDQAKAALAATKADLKGVGDAARGASVEGAKVGPALAGGATKATPAIAGLEGKLEELKVELGSVVAAEKDAVAQTAALAAQASKLEANLIASGNGAKASGGGMRMLTQQLSQVGQQTMASGNFVQALAIQLPDIGLAFGAVGTAAGLMAGVALPIVMSAFGGTADQGEALEKQLGALISAMDEYDRYTKQSVTSTVELSEKFGVFASQVKGFSEYMAGVALGKSLEEMSTTIDPLKAGLSGVLVEVKNIADAKSYLASIPADMAQDIANAKDNLAVFESNAAEAAAKLGLSVDQVVALSAALDALGNATQMEDIRDKAGAALAILQQMVPVGSELPAPLRDAAEALAGIASKAAESTNNLEPAQAFAAELAARLMDAVAAAQQLAGTEPGPGWLDGAISKARLLAFYVGTAINAAAGVGTPNGPAFERGGKNGSSSAPYIAPALTLDEVIKKNAPKASGGGGGGGGAAKIDPDSFNALVKAAEDALQTLEDKVAAIHEKVRLGLMSTAEGTKAIASAKDQAANSIADLIPKLEKVADAAGPKAAAAVAKWRAEVKGLVGDLNEASAGLADRLSSNFEKGFADFLSGAKKGKAAMADFKNFVIQQLAAIAAQRFTESIITPFIDSIVGSITGGLSGGTAVETNARGGVYAGPGISAYSGSVVNRPTFFPFAKGTGLMGEAGPEAILPLDRDGSGRLGVRASGGGGGDMIVNISTPAGSKTSQTQRSDGNNRILDVVVEMVEGAIAGNVAQSRGPMADAMTSTYGLSRVAR
ncbi:MAG: hypothetical protein CFE33_15030 [Pseudorhodobacter sp. PARRP1]|nr:MAG: hypothetical protein CFE33_15030 [Pseudorhodobacter sp. PARRP1]